MGSNEDGLWVRRFHPSPDAAARLVCFPHAGGSASYFHPVSAALAPGIEVLAIQYPGRQDRRSEPLVDDLHLLADHIAGVLRSWPDKPMTFFGHSMGATLAFETTRRLESAGTGPAALLVSARRSPTTTRTETVHLRDDMGVVDEIRRLGGTDAQLLDNDEIIEMILPATRNDYRAVETYRYRPGPPVRCPITALIGQDDPKVTAEEALDWQRHTTGAFDLRVFSGGHFYLGTNRREVLELLRCAAVG